VDITYLLIYTTPSASRRRAVPFATSNAEPGAEGGDGEPAGRPPPGSSRSSRRRLRAGGRRATSPSRRSGLRRDQRPLRTEVRARIRDDRSIPFDGSSLGHSGRLIRPPSFLERGGQRRDHFSVSDRLKAGSIVQTSPPLGIETSQGYPAASSSLLGAADASAQRFKPGQWPAMLLGQGAETFRDPLASGPRTRYGYRLGSTALRPDDQT
jgi:hypothetical protein